MSLHEEKDWPQYRIHILESLERLEKNLGKFEAEIKEEIQLLSNSIAETNSNYTNLKIKIYGLTFGLSILVLILDIYKFLQGK